MRGAANLPTDPRAHISHYINTPVYLCTSSYIHINTVHTCVHSFRCKHSVNTHSFTGTHISMWNEMKPQLLSHFLVNFANVKITVKTLQIPPLHNISALNFACSFRRTQRGWLHRNRETMIAEVRTPAWNGAEQHLAWHESNVFLLWIFWVMYLHEVTHSDQALIQIICQVNTACVLPLNMLKEKGRKKVLTAASPFSSSQIYLLDSTGPLVLCRPPSEEQ